MHTIQFKQTAKVLRVGVMDMEAPLALEIRRAAEEAKQSGVDCHLVSDCGTVEVVARYATEEIITCEVRQHAEPCGLWIVLDQIGNAEVAAKAREKRMEEAAAVILGLALIAEAVAAMEADEDCDCEVCRGMRNAH